MTTKSEILKQIDVILDIHRDLRSRSQYQDCSDQPDIETTSVATLMCDTINRFAPSNSQYLKSMEAIIQKNHVSNPYVIPHVAGVLKALRIAYAADYLTTISELIHANLFSDFLEMAEHLLCEGYKDPAAVIVGSTLEEHLRVLCIKKGIDTSVAGKPKKADALNAELAVLSAYSKLDQKSITAWLDLRNKAAHGKYSEYSQDQVKLFLQGVRDFMIRVPG